MKITKKSIGILLCIIAVLLGFAWFGLGDSVKGVRQMRYGIDIRGGVEAVFEPVGLTEKATVEQMDAVKLQIFVDTSSIEIFVNDGEGTFTSRVFPQAGETGLSLAAGSTIDYRLDLWELA